MSSHFFSISRPSEWESLKRTVLASELGRQHPISLRIDLKSKSSILLNGQEEINHLNNVKQRIVSKLGKKASPQKIINAITSSTVIVADTENTSTYKLNKFLNDKAPFFFPAPKRYLWVLNMNAPAVALIKHYQDLILKHQPKGKPLTFNAIIVSHEEVTAEKVINASTNFKNIIMHKDVFNVH